MTAKDTAQGNVPQVERKPSRTQGNGQETNAATEQAAAELLKSHKRRGTNRQLREQLNAAIDRANLLHAELHELRTRESMQADERTASLLERIEADRVKIEQLRELCGQYKHRAQYITADYLKAYKLAVSYIAFDNACKAYVRRLFPEADEAAQIRSYQTMFGKLLEPLEEEMQTKLGAQIMDAAAGFID